MSETFQLEYIHLHPDIQVRIYQNDDALERYTELYKADSKSLPPIKICISSKDQKFYLIDGHHRFRAAKAAGLTMIQAENLGEMDFPQMVQESIRANCQQGLALSKADRKRAAEMLAKYNPEITVRAAAEAVGLSKSLVATILKEYREKQVAQCSECKATVLRLFAEDPTNGWIHVPESKRERWFCCEDHRREFYAKQAEKEAERQAKREQDEEARNAELEFGSDNGSEPDNGPFRFYEHIPEPQRDYDPKPCMDPHFKIQPCYKCGARAFYSHPDHYSHIVKCSNDECGYFNSELTKDEALYTWNALYNVNKERDQHSLCPRCGSIPEMTIDHLHRERKFSVICPNIKCNFPAESHHETFPQDAWNYWDDVAFIETERSKEQEAENAKEPGYEPEIELEPSNMFSKLLLKFLRIGYKWYAKDHGIKIRLLKSPEGEEMLFFDLETDGGCHHNGCYVIPNLLKIDFPTVPEEAEK